MKATLPLSRRALLGAALALLAGCAAAPVPAPAPAELPPPIVFVHGNGDHAGLWMTTVWRFESNGWPASRLFALDQPYPLARDLDTVAQPGRSSTAEHVQFLSSQIDRVLRLTGAKQVVLIGNSRGGNAIRNYVANWRDDAGRGADRVSHVVLGGTPNHGVFADAAVRPEAEFNGAGPFLTALNNQGALGVEITPGPRWMTVRSDRNDKFAQPEGTWIGMKGVATKVGFDGPELKGAENVVLPGIDHRETSYGPAAFAAAYRFVTGKAPRTTEVMPEAQVVLDGLVSGFGIDNVPSRGGSVSNLPLVGATVEVHATDAGTGARVGGAAWRKTVGADGRWGPFTAQPGTPYEFVVTAPGHAVTHTYRAAFPRSSAIVNLRAERALPEAERSAGAIVVLARPRGYFGLPRDTVVLDGQNPAPGIPQGVAGVGTSRLRLEPGPQRSVEGRFNQQRIVGRTWPAAENHLVQIELHD